MKVLVGVLLLLLSAVGVRAEESTEKLFSAVMVDTQGQPMPLASFRGKPIIVAFWARWCVPCRQEFPVLMELQKKYAKQGLEVLGIALEDKDSTEKVRDFLAAYQVSYPVALASEGGMELMQSLGEPGPVVIPYTLVIDRKGKILLSIRGTFRKGDFQSVAGKLFR